MKLCSSIAKLASLIFNRAGFGGILIWVYPRVVRYVIMTINLKVFEIFEASFLMFLSNSDYFLVTWKLLDLSN